MDTRELRYWIGFNRINGIGAVRMKALLAHFSSMEDAWHASDNTLMSVIEDRRALASVLKMRQNIDLDADLITLDKIGARAVTVIDEDYPPLLRQIDNAPPLIYVKGDIQAVDNRAMAIVGTRSATAYGLRVTRGLAHALAKTGWTVVSGLAKGIDAAAHATAMRYGGRTFALLGHGIDQIYPPDHGPLAMQISKQGALITEYPLGTPPDGRNFPARNRLISGLSRGVVVVEASLKSGALSTIRHATEQGREAFAVPGPIDSPESAGTNGLIQKGHAKLVATSADLWAELEPGLLVPLAFPPPSEPETAPKPGRTKITEAPVKPARKVAKSSPKTALPTLTASDLRAMEGIDEQTIGVWEVLRNRPLNIDDLGSASGLAVAQVTAAITLLEIYGLVRQDNGLLYPVTEFV